MGNRLGVGRKSGAAGREPPVEMPEASDWRLGGRALVGWAGAWNGWTHWLSAQEFPSTALLFGLTIYLNCRLHATATHGIKLGTRVGRAVLHAVSRG